MLNNKMENTTSTITINGYVCALCNILQLWSRYLCVCMFLCSLLLCCYLHKMNTCFRLVINIPPSLCPICWYSFCMFIVGVRAIVSAYLQARARTRPRPYICFCAWWFWNRVINTCQWVFDGVVIAHQRWHIEVVREKKTETFLRHLNVNAHSAKNAHSANLIFIMTLAHSKHFWRVFLLVLPSKFKQNFLFFFFHLRFCCRRLRRCCLHFSEMKLMLLNNFWLQFYSTSDLGEYGSMILVLKCECLRML